MSRVDLNKPLVPAASTRPTASSRPPLGVLDLDLSLRRGLQSVDRRLRRIDNTLAGLADTDPQQPVEPVSPWPWLAIAMVWVAAGTVVTTSIIVFGRVGNVYVGDAGILSLIGALTATGMILYFLHAGG